MKVEMRKTGSSTTFLGLPSGSNQIQTKNWGVGVKGVGRRQPPAATASLPNSKASTAGAASSCLIDIVRSYRTGRTKNKPPMTGCGPRSSLLLLLLLLVAGSEAGAPPPLRTDCPSWLTDYITWHRENKFAPDAKYMLYDCPGGSCSGLGDRLRGILWMLRMSAYAKRVLIIRMDQPAPMQRFFLPTHIDWTVPATSSVNGSAPVTLQVPGNGLGELWGDYANSTIMEIFRTSNYKWIATRTNEHEDYPYPGEPMISAYSVAAGCSLKALFQPSEEVEQVVTRHFAEMQVNPSKPYIALHLRTWNLKGEGESNAHTLESEERILTSIMCARHMASQCNVDLSVNPAVLVTDGVHLRRRVALRLYQQLTTSDITPHHFDAEENHGLIEKHLETFADFVILSRATGLFTDANSGFSRLASYLGSLTNEGSHPCLQQNQICSEYRKALDYRVPLQP